MKTSTNYRLGIFVLSGIAFLIIGLYYIGSKKNIFHSTIKVSAVFNNVDGLLSGQNVRFNGINIGTIQHVTATGDTLVRVDFTIDKEVTKYISKNAIASLGSDGLLGDKLINITCFFEGSPIKDGDVLRTESAVQISAAMRTFSGTNENIKKASSDLKSIMNKLDQSRFLWGLLSDTAMTEDIKYFVRKIKSTGMQSESAAARINFIAEKIKNGKGSLNAVVEDTNMSSNLKRSINRLYQASDSIASVSNTISSIVNKINSGRGSLGTLLNDTLLARDLYEGVHNLKKGAGGFNENMDALKDSWPFKKHFKKQKRI